MSFELLRHTFQTAPERVVSKSYLDCHVKGMHSIMLIDCPGAVVRMFVTTPDHEMWKNTPGVGTGEKMSLGYHGHRTELTLHLVRGRMINIIGQVKKGLYFIPNSRRVSGYRFVSKILNEEGGGKFEPLGSSEVIEGATNNMRPGDTAYMPADMLHTVYVPRGESAAWFVYEGSEDPKFDSTTWSDADLTKFEAEGLYRRPTVEQVAALLKELVF